MMNRRGTGGWHSTTASWRKHASSSRATWAASSRSSSTASRRRAGEDYRVVGDELVFPRRLAKEGRLGFWRWLSLLLGVAGTYRQNDSVDIVYERGGRRVVATGLPVFSEQQASE